MDLTSRLRTIVRSGPPKPVRELTYEPEPAGYEATIELTRVADALGGRPVQTPFGPCLVIDRRYESDRWHGAVRIGDCELSDFEPLRLLDPALPLESALLPPMSSGDGAGNGARRAVFIDLETTGLSGGAGTVAFLVGCGYFDLGAFQVRQFLLTSHSAERALLAAVASFFDEADVIVTYNGKTFDVPVMETRWTFHRMEMPLDGVPHFDMLHTARRLWRSRTGDSRSSDERGEFTGAAWGLPSRDATGCRLVHLEQALLGLERRGDVPSFEIPTRFFHFLRFGDPRPLEPVLEHNRLDLVSLAAVTARAARLATGGVEACADCAEALSLGRVYERAQNWERAEACYRRAAESRDINVRAEALFRLGLRLRRDRRFEEAAGIWREILALTAPGSLRRRPPLRALRRFASEALAVHHEHRTRDLDGARELALFALEECGEREPGRVAGLRHRLARLERKLARRQGARLWPS